MIDLKSDHEISLIKEAGRIVKEVLEALRNTQPGTVTKDLDKKAEEIIKDNGGISAFKGYNGFPANICTSINEEVVHGIPGNRRLKPGDILSIDVGVKKNGFFADAAITIEIGDSISENIKRLVKVTRESLESGINQAVEGNRLFDISYAIQKHAELNGYSVVREFVGHGIGKKLHEEPEIPNFGRPGTGPRLKRGMVLAIEPMVNEGLYKLEILKDGWTAVTKDRRLSAHFEHTICVTDGSPEILT